MAREPGFLEVAEGLSPEVPWKRAGLQAAPTSSLQEPHPNITTMDSLNLASGP